MPRISLPSLLVFLILKFCFFFVFFGSHQAVVVNIFSWDSNSKCNLLMKRNLAVAVCLWFCTASSSCRRRSKLIQQKIKPKTNKIYIIFSSYTVLMLRRILSSSIISKKKIHPIQPYKVSAHFYKQQQNKFLIKYILLMECSRLNFVVAHKRARC